MSQLLIHIGYAKAGSTFLQYWFYEHPEIHFQHIFMSGGFIHPKHLASFAEKTDKLPSHYVMSSEFIASWTGDVEYYGMQFNSNYDYFKYQKNMSQMLKEIFPTAKILIVTRGYTTVFRSSYSQYIATGGRLSFRDIFKRMDFLISSYDYTAVINLYQKQFGNDKVLFLPFEKLKDNPSEFIEMVESFMEMKTKFQYGTEVKNESLNPKTLVVFRTISKVVYILLYPFPKKIRRNMYKRYVFSTRTKTIKSLLNWLSKFVSKPIDMKEEKEYIDKMKGKAEILKNNLIYKPYLKDYLIDED